MQEKVDFLKEALAYSAKASDHFSLFWNHSQDSPASAQKAHACFLNSLEALQKGLICLENPPFDKKSKYQMQTLSRKGQRLLKSLGTEELWSRSAALPLERLTQLYAYFDLLADFKKRLNQLIIRENDYFSEPQTWKELSQIHPNILIKFYGVYFSFLFGLKRRNSFVICLDRVCFGRKFDLENILPLSPLPCARDCRSASRSRDFLPSGLISFYLQGK